MKVKIFNCGRDEMVQEPPVNEVVIDDESSAVGVNDDVDECTAQPMAHKVQVYQRRKIMITTQM